MVVVYGEEPWLEACVRAVLDSTGVDVDVVLVENGGSESVIASLESDPAVTVVRPGRNTGFAEGCDLGVAASVGAIVALVNPDALVEPDALAALCAGLDHHGVGVVTASVRLADRPDLLNSAGNDINVLGLSWSGHFEEPASDHDRARPVAAASGAAMACRRSHWDDLGGLVPDFFAYYEDAEFSVRTWQRGLEVRFIPDAVVRHRYEFSRNPGKFFLLERNRLAMTLTCFRRRHLLAIAPLLLVLEVGVVALALRGGWFGEKMRAYRWLLGHAGWLRIRRRQVQSDYTAQADPRFMDLLVTHLQPGNMRDAHPPVAVQNLVDRYWRLVAPFARR